MRSKYRCRAIAEIAAATIVTTVTAITTTVSR